MIHSRFAYLLVSTLFVWVTFTGSANAAGWTPGPQIEAPMVGSFGTNDLAMAADGTSTIVWKDIRDESGPIFMRRLDPNGSFGPKTTIGSGRYETLEVTPGGTAVVAWIEPTGDPDDRLRLSISWIAPDGTRTDRTVSRINNDPQGPPLLAVAPNGDVAIAWADDIDDDLAGLLSFRRITFGGPASDTVSLGRVSPDELRRSGDLVLNSSGKAFLSWLRPYVPDVNDARIARFSPDGVLETEAQISNNSPSAWTQLASKGNTAVVIWREKEFGGSGPLKIARLQTGGTLIAYSRVISSDFPIREERTALAMSPEGTAYIATDGNSQRTIGGLFLTRLTLDGTLQPEVQVSGPTTFMVGFPRLAPGKDGSLIVGWTGVGLAASLLQSRIVDEAGQPMTPIATVPGSESPLTTLGRLASNGAGIAVMAWPAFLRRGDDPGDYLIKTATLDEVPPTVDVRIPAKAVRGEDTAMSVVAEDPAGIAGIEWEFSDGNSRKGAEVVHAFARAGTYEVKVTVTDGADNSTVISRSIDVREPGTTNRVSARLKVKKAIRKKAKVSVTGTINPLATGKVTLTWHQKAGRKTAKVVKKTKIRNGKFTATIKLNRKLARARTKGKLTVAYAGNALTRSAKVTRSVKPKR